MKTLIGGLVASLALLAACAPAAPPAPPAAGQASLDPAQCSAAGGTVKPVCRLQRPQCVISYPDAGKACTDGSQCGSGKCVTDRDAAPGAPAQGVCKADNDPCGCVTPVVNGKVGAGLCVD